MLLTRRFYGVDRLSLNNEVAGFKFAVVGVFYAVLLAFVVIAVWEEFRDTEAAVRDEAKAVVDLHRVAHALGGVERKSRSARSWPPISTTCASMNGRQWRSASRARSTAEALDRLSQAVFNVQPQSSANSPSTRTRSDCWR